MSGFESVISLPGRPGSSLVLLADHARALLPPAYGDLGLPEDAFRRHIAYDIGVEPLTRALAERLGAPAVMAGFSRLLIDPNRGEDDPTLVMRISDGAIIPGNHPITADEIERRLALYYRPYHRAVASAIGDATIDGRPPLVISMHSFTPVWKSFVRPWHAGILWDSDGRAARPLIDRLAAAGDIVVGDNEPYDGALKGDCMYRHCMVPGIAHALIEVRQDLIADPDGVSAWCDRLAPILAELDADPALHQFRQHPSRTGPYPG